MKIKMKTAQLGTPTKSCLKLTLPSGGFGLLKFNYTGKRFKSAGMRRRMSCEKTALKILQGLAVPRLIDLKKRDIFISDDKIDFLVTEWVPWKSCFDVRLNFSQAVGVWLFFLEQICAFRRSGILYTDIKPTHILVDHDVARAMIIDFDYATASNDRATYPFWDVGWTLSFIAPEHCLKKEIAESALVYQAALLLAALLKKRMSNFEFHDSPGEKLRDKLRREGHADLGILLKRSASLSPKERPATYEVLFDEALSCVQSPSVLKVWKQLRTPYEKALSDLNLFFPNNFPSSVKKRAA